MTFRILDKILSKNIGTEIFLNPDGFVFDIISDLSEIGNEVFMKFYLTRCIKIISEIWHKNEKTEIKKKETKNSKKKKRGITKKEEVLTANYTSLIKDLKDLEKEFSYKIMPDFQRENKEQVQSIMTLCETNNKTEYQGNGFVWMKNKKDFAAWINFLEDNKFIQGGNALNKKCAEIFSFYDRKTGETAISTPKKIRDMRSRVRNPYSLINIDEILGDKMEKSKRECNEA